MGRLISVIGVLLIVAGFGGLFAGSFLSSFNFDNFNPGSLGASPTTAQLCKAGETLVDEKGASQYTQGQGYASAVQYFCETADGIRRNVTADFVNNLAGQASGFIANIARDLSKQFLWGGMIAGGFILLAIGLAVSRGRSRGIRHGDGGPQIYVNGQPVRSGSQIYMNGQTMTSQAGGWPQAGPSASPSLADKLRQLESAHNAGLITREEYDRVRQAIIKEM